MCRERERAHVRACCLLESWGVCGSEQQARSHGRAEQLPRAHGTPTGRGTARGSPSTVACPPRARSSLRAAARACSAEGTSGGSNIEMLLSVCSTFASRMKLWGVLNCVLFLRRAQNKCARWPFTCSLVFLLVPVIGGWAILGAATARLPLTPCSLSSQQAGGCGPELIRQEPSPLRGLAFRWR